MKTPVLLLRIASALLLLVAAAMGFAHAYRYEMAGPEGQLVLDTMARPTDFDGDTSTYLRLYDGMSISLVVMYLFLAVALWLFSAKITVNPKPMGPQLFAVCGLLAANSVVSFMYFFPPPGILQALACVFALVAYRQATTHRLQV